LEVTSTLVCCRQTEWTQLGSALAASCLAFFAHFAPLLFFFAVWACKDCRALPENLPSLFFGRNGKEGWSQTDAGVVQAGAGEECLGSLRVWIDDIVSECARLRTGDYVTNSIRNLSVVSNKEWKFQLFVHMQKYGCSFKALSPFQAVLGEHTSCSCKRFWAVQKWYVAPSGFGRVHV